MSNLSTLTTTDFDEDVKTSELPILVDFWAEWCPPCRAIAPVLDEIAGEKIESLRIAKVNVDEHPDLASRFGVKTIPTLLLFKDGVQTDLQIVGAKSKQQLLEEIQPYL